MCVPFSLGVSILSLFGQVEGAVLFAASMNCIIMVSKNARIINETVEVWRMLFSTVLL